MTNNSYLGLTAHQLLVAELGAQNSIPRDGEIPRILPGIGTSSYVPSTSLYAPQQPLPPSGHPPISTGYSPKPYSGNYQSRRGRGNVLSNLISPRATSSDFLPVTLRFLLFYFILFYFIIFYYILLYFILFYFIIFFFILFYFILIYFILFYFILFYFILF